MSDLKKVNVERNERRESDVIFIWESESKRCSCQRPGLLQIDIVAHIEN
jgi:hypothetical protein